ncbi:MAG: DUF21 domain-containing protein [Planctomycetaceae bacterium]|nr:DUF21 domain-containing protein [Planctomycetaceae bacterium]
MTLSMTLFAAAFLFLAGLRLSAFFSGSETGFYRVSTLQLALQKQRGEPIATRLFYFATHPERFVATTLVGNNVANYLITLAVGLFSTSVWSSSSGAAEVVSTLAVTPVVFIFGELIPKSLFYRSPMRLLRSGSLVFSGCYVLFLPITLPLIWMSRFIARFGTDERRPLEIVFGRNRLYGVLEAGQQEGILTGLQRNLAENLMQVAAQPVEQSMIPATAVQGLEDSVSTETLLKHSERLDESYILLAAKEQPRQWSHFVRIVDLVSGSAAPRLVMRPLPRFPVHTARLEVLTMLFRLNVPYGVVVENDRVVGVISRQTLVSQLFRTVRPSSNQLESLLAGIGPS